MNRTRFVEELQSYMATMLWTATDEEGNALDAEHDLDDFDSNAWKDAEQDLSGFIGLCESEGIDVDSLPAGQVGHDFSLTRNHHGAGFWDRGNGQLGDDLTKWAHTFGEVYVIVGDDGKLHTEG